MRSAICVATFIVLLLIGFLATPGIFRIVNPEYLLAASKFGSTLAELTKSRGDIEADITRVETQISEQQRDKKALTVESTARQAELNVKNAPKDEIVTVAIEFGKRISAIDGAIEQLSGQLKQLQSKKASNESSLAEIKKQLDAPGADSNNIYIVARALALGAIGAMMSVFAKYLAAPNRRSLFEENASLGRLWISMAMGSIVSVVVIGLFFTGFISIFANAAQNTGETDFWKVTILCLIAGAFSDRLFESAANRMGVYLRDASSDERAPAKVKG